MSARRNPTLVDPSACPHTLQLSRPPIDFSLENSIFINARAFLHFPQNWTEHSCITIHLHRHCQHTPEK